MAARGVQGPSAALRDRVMRLAKLNNALEKLVSKLGSPADGPGMRREFNQQRVEANELAKEIMAALREESSATPEVRRKLNREFQTELEKLQRVCREFESKEKDIIVAMSASVSQGSALRSPSNNGDAQLDAQFHVMDLQAIQERQEGIRKIERDVTELAEMFKDLQTLVVQQQDSLNVVEENVQRTKAETEQGLKELQEAERLQNKARKRMCFILAILVIILAVIVLIALGVTGNL